MEEDEQGFLQAFRTLAAFQTGARNSSLAPLRALDTALLDRILVEAWSTHPCNPVYVARVDQERGKRVAWLIFFGPMEQTFRSKGISKGMTRSTRGGGSASADSAVDVDAMLLEAQKDIETNQEATPFQLVNTKTEQAVPLQLVPMSATEQAFYVRRRKKVKFQYHSKTAMSASYVWEPAEELDEGDWMLVTEKGLMAPFGDKRADFALVTDAQLMAIVQHHNYMSFNENWYLERNPGGNLWLDRYDSYGMCTMSVPEIKKGDGYSLGCYPNEMAATGVKREKSVEFSAKACEPAPIKTTVPTAFATTPIEERLLGMGVALLLPWQVSSGMVIV
jgi:hypothetical protein